MLDIVDKYDGDVVKFAGDALFIVWETEIAANSNKTRNSSRATVDVSADTPILELPAESMKNDTAFTFKMSISKAVECGKEISAVCGNHKVQLTQQKFESKTPTPSPSMFRTLLPSLGHMFGGSHHNNHSNAPSPRGSIAETARGGADDEDNVAYLNVHSGKRS